MASRDVAIVEVTVFDFRSKPVPSASVTLSPAVRGAGKRTSLKFDRWAGVHRAEVRPGQYRLHTKASGYEAQDRDITVPQGRVSETVVLGEPGMPFIYRGRVPNPFQRRDELLAVSTDPSHESEGLEALLRELKLSFESPPELAAAQGFRLIRMPRRMSAARREKILDRLREHGSVVQGGPVLLVSDEHVIFATNELVVRFQSWVTEAEVAGFAERHRLELLRSFSYAGNAYLFRAREAPSYALLERFAKLASEGEVYYAEPNLVSSAVPDQVVPDDHLYANQWHLPFIGLPAGWQTLRDHSPPGVLPGTDGDLTFGSQEIVIAIMDQGVESRDVMGVTTPHPDFSGSVTGGAAKMFAWIDWINLVPDNDSPLGGHGTNCAGVAAARADNPSTVAGEDEGVVGAAGNCRLLGMIYPSGHPEVDFSDAYIWAAGFDPHSARAGFPAPLARGADVFSTSVGFFTGVAISGIMKDCFDHIATYGRGGRGAVCFFSAGNANSVFNLQRPWAAYERNFAIAASTDGDVRAGYSNYGNGIDVCAPSSGGAQAITTTDRVGLGTVAGHTGGSNDYQTGFGGTSSATPFTAGVAALLLSVNSTLTCVELRQILQSTAVKIDFANADPTGMWVDTDGDGVKDYSQWYGNGRIDAAAAIIAARDFAHDIDLVVRETIADTGAVPSAGTWWESPDLWVRTHDPVTDGAAALPATYTDSPPHQDAAAGSATNYVYARIRNNGARTSYDYYVRFYITHFPGTEFTYPTSFIPTTRPSDPIPSPLVPGTYLIGEVHRTGLAPGAVDIVSQNWPQALIPPADVVVGASTVHWHPCLLLEVAPHDGPTSTGPHIWDDNNLAQRNITIAYPDSVSGDFQAGMVVGGPSANGRAAAIEIDRSSVPPWVDLYVELPGRHLLVGHGQSGKAPYLGRHGGREVVWLARRGRTRIPLDLREGELALLVIGSATKATTAPLRGRVDVVQVGADGRRQGGYSIELRRRK